MVSALSGHANAANPRLRSVPDAHMRGRTSGDSSFRRPSTRGLHVRATPTTDGSLAPHPSAKNAEEWGTHGQIHRFNVKGGPPVPTSSGTRVLLDGKDVTQRVREADVTAGASRVSVHPKVREWMVARQQELGAGGGVVMEGRDIGTKVFPNADVKIFLDADPVVREQRRLQQQNLRGSAAEATAAELRERDRRDRTRAASPLTPAPDALMLDSTKLSEDEVLRRVEELVQQKLAL